MPIFWWHDWGHFILFIKYFLVKYSSSIPDNNIYIYNFEQLFVHLECIYKPRTTETTLDTWEVQNKVEDNSHLYTSFKIEKTEI